MYFKEWIKKMREEARIKSWKELEEKNEANHDGFETKPQQDGKYDSNMLKDLMDEDQDQNGHVNGNHS